MDQRKHHYQEHPWDDSVYGTGRTEPPKNRGGLIALLLIFIIFLCGIITALSILNVRLFRELNTQEESDLSLSFSSCETTPVEISTRMEETTQATVPQGSHSIVLQQAPVVTDSESGTGELSLQQIYKNNINSVVSIMCEQETGSSSGTGVILSQDGYIVTNCHVVEDADSITVRLTDERDFSAMLVGTDAVSDLAVLYIEADNLLPAQFGNSDSLQVGDSVTAIGDPLGVEFRGTYTNGIVSAINRDVTVDGRTMTLIQTNAALNSGNSGGPLINCYGQVIGINTMKISAFTNAAGVEGLGFAIPSSTVKNVVEQLINQGYVSGRPTLGIEGEALSTFYQHYYRLPAGLYITDIASGCDADRKGLEEGDILMSIAGTGVTTMDDLNAVVYGYAVGDTVDVIIYRGGNQYRVDLTLEEDKG